MSNNALTTLTSQLATKLNMGDGRELIETLKATAFKGQVNDAQMTALMVVANQYGLNPWTREIYAFPDKNNGIVPVVGVDGWSRIINEHPQFDGLDFEQTDEACTCIVYRKDRSRPIRVTEYMSECKRPNVGPWTSHPKRMLRHKALIQAARLAFGYTGIYDQDEADRILEGSEKTVNGGHATHAKASDILPGLSDENFIASIEKYEGWIRKGKTADEVISYLSTTNTLSEHQVNAIYDIELTINGTGEAA